MSDYKLCGTKMLFQKIYLDGRWKISVSVETESALSP